MNDGILAIETIMAILAMCRKGEDVYFSENQLSIRYASCLDIKRDGEGTFIHIPRDGIVTIKDLHDLILNNMEDDISDTKEEQIKFNQTLSSLHDFKMKKVEADANT